MYLEKFVIVIKPGSWTVWNFTHTLLSLPLWNKIPRLVGNADCCIKDEEMMIQNTNYCVCLWRITLRYGLGLGWGAAESGASESAQTCTVLWFPMVWRAPLRWAALLSDHCHANEPAAHTRLWRLKYLPLCSTGRSKLKDPAPPHPSCFLSKLSSFLFHCQSFAINAGCKLLPLLIIDCLSDRF